MNTPEGSAPTAMELLDQANGLPFGSEERDLLQRALSSAQETGDRDAEYRVRLSLVASYRAAEDNSALLTHFSAAAGLHDSDPQRFPGSSDGSYPHLFWYYKHAINVVTMSCLFSRPQADALLDQMATHYARAGVPENAVDIERREDQLVNGTLAETEAIQARILANGGEDPFDDCPTCRIAGQLALDLRAGRTEEAQARVEEILQAGDIGCVMEPESSLAAVMMTALRHGDADFAGFAQRTSIAANPRFQSLRNVGRHLEFLGVTGNYSRGLALLQRYQRDLLVDRLDTLGHFGVLSGAWVLLAATVRAGFGEVKVPGSGTAELVAVYGELSGDGSDHTVAALAERCRTAATELAARYDVRNGNDNFARLIAEAEELSRLDIPLDLGSSDLLLRAELADPAASPASVVAGADETDPDERLCVLETAVRAQASHDVAALLASGDPYIRVEDLPEWHRPSYHSRLVSHYHHTGDRAARDGHYEDLVNELFRQGRGEAEFYAGIAPADFLDVPADDVPAWSGYAAELRGSDPLAYLSISLRAVATLAAAATEPDPDGDEMRLETAQEDTRNKLGALVAFAGEHRRDVDPSGTAGMILAEYYASAAINLLVLDVISGHADPEEAQSRYESLRADFADFSPSHATGLDLYYGMAATGTGIAEGVYALDRHLATLIDLRLREATGTTALDTARVLAHGGRFEEAAERARLAVRQLDAAELPSRDASLFLGEMLVYQQRSAEAVDVLEPLLLPKLEQYHHATTEDEGGPVPEFSEYEIRCIHGLGLSLRQTAPTPLLPLWTLRQSRDLALSNGEDQLAVMSVIALTDILHGLDRWEEAIEEMTTTLPAAARLNDSGQAEMRLRDRIAVSQADAGDPAALDTLAQNMELASDTGQRLYVQESINRVLSTFGRLDECLEGCRKASRMVLSLDDPSSAAAQLAQGANYAMSAEQPDSTDRAIEILTEAQDVPGIPGEQAAHYCRVIADLYEDAGKSRKARKWRSRADSLDRG